MLRVLHKPAVTHFDSWKYLNGEEGMPDQLEHTERSGTRSVWRVPRTRSQMLADPAGILD